MQILTPLLPEQISGSVELACCEITDHHTEKVLTCDEKLAWNTFESSTRRNEYLASRWLVRQMAIRMDMNSGCFRLQKDDEGRPFGVYNDTQYFVSIAHSKRDTLCAISPTVNVGVDLEPKTRSVSDRLRSRLLNDGEQKLLANEPTIRLWTLKEAVLKFYGSGLRTNLRDWSIVSKNKSLFTAVYKTNEQVRVYSSSYQNNWIALAFNL